MSRNGEMTDLVSRVVAEQNSVLADHLLKKSRVPASWVPVAREAIIRAENGEYGAVLKLPNGYHRTAREIITGLHLDKFVGA